MQKLAKNIHKILVQNRPDILYTRASWEGGPETLHEPTKRKKAGRTMEDTHECYGEVTTASGKTRWVWLGWANEPDREPVKETAKFRFYDTPCGREKYRK